MQVSDDHFQAESGCRGSARSHCLYLQGRAAQDPKNEDITICQKHSVTLYQQNAQNCTIDNITLKFPTCFST